MSAIIREATSVVSAVLLPFAGLAQVPTPLTISTVTIVEGSVAGQPISGIDGIAVDASGNIYVSDVGNNAIKKISMSGNVELLAGSPIGSPGYADGTGTSALFNRPGNIAVDGAGNVYVADYGNNAIREISPAGAVSTIGPTSFAAQGSGDAEFSEPTAVAVDNMGDVFVTDAGHYQVKEISPNGSVSVVATIHTQYGWLNGIAVDTQGNIYVSDAVGPFSTTGSPVGTNTIDKIEPGGAVTTFAGQPGIFGSSDGAGASATFSRPMGLAVDSSGNLFVADAGNNAIREITPSGSVSTLAGGGGSGMADGTGRQAQFNMPMAVTVDKNEDFYIADSDNKAVRRGIPSGFTASAVRFANLSTLATVGPSASMTAGFIISGSTAQTVLIRAVGPTLKYFGVSQPLPQPKLDVYNADGNVVASSDSGINVTDVTSAAGLVGAFQLQSGGADAALVMTLAPGSYTAKISSGDGSQGSVLVEVYEVP